METHLQGILNGFNQADPLLIVDAQQTKAKVLSVTGICGHDQVCPWASRVNTF
jgi:hypothetical protein